LNKKPEEVDSTYSGFPQVVQSWQVRREIQQTGILLFTHQQQQEEENRQAQHNEEHTCKQLVNIQGSNLNSVCLV
jgi:hypothetical protein